MGSFLGVLIDRIPKGEQILKGRSHCDNCKKDIAPFDLIPVISFIFLRGKCRYCKAKLSYFYPFIELVTGGLFSLTFFHVLTLFQFPSYQFAVMLLYLLIVASLLLVIFFADIRHGIIPDKVVLFLLVFCGLSLILFMRGDFLNHLFAALISFAFFFALFLITKGRGMGFGDVKFSFVLGLISGFPMFIISLYIAFLTGSIVSIILILWGKKRLSGDTIPFGPFLVLGLMITLYFGSYILPWVLSLLNL